MKRKLLQYSSIAAALVFVAVFFGLAFYNTPSSTAVKATDFQAGRIIDDEIFYNKDTMTVAEIQAFLDSHTPACDVWGQKTLGAARYHAWGTAPATMKRADYAKWRREVGGDSRYHDPPYVCVNLYYENPTTHETNFDTKLEKKEGMLSAAEIIYQAAQKYNINPQVLLVMLKKESYAWGDDWPIKWGYNTIMGYGCPDTAPCDEKYYGFYNQMMMAAWQLNYYKDHIYSYGYFPYATNNIYYSPTASCGTKKVYLENIATTSLYIYTPYTPNDAALKNYPGTATCGSYGNRNFFMYFNEWFGTTLLSSVSKVPAVNLPTTSLRITGADSTKTIQLKELSKEDVKVVHGEAKNNELDTFTLSRNIDGTYLVKNDYSSLVLDIPLNAVFVGQTLQQHNSNGTNAQKWLIYQHDDETYSFVSVSNQAFALSYHENSLVLERYTGANYQKFKFATNTSIADENTTTQPEEPITPVVPPEGSDDPEETEVKVGVISDGNYYVKSVLKDNYVLGSTASANQNVHMLLNKKSITKNFEFKYDATSDSYTIRSVQYNKYLDSSNENATLLDKKDDCSQKWTISKNTDETYKISNVCNSKVLDISGGIVADGTNAQLWRNNGTNAQKWKLEAYIAENEVDNSRLSGTYKIASALNNNLVIDAKGNGRSNGTNIQIHTSNGTNAQQWILRYNENLSSYTIIGKSSKKAVDIANGNTSAGSNIQLWNDNKTCAQQWDINSNTDGTYTITNHCSKRVIDVRNGSAFSDNNVQIWNNNGTNAQKWKFIKLSD